MKKISTLKLKSSRHYHLNASLVEHVMRGLISLNVKEVIVCAGARNVPILEGLETFNCFQVYSFFEERSAAFYALGRCKSSQLPVAIVTTSGTAVAELLPAVIEAYYQELPLILITADRPKSYRGSGAPQAIEQSRIFGSYVENVFDWDKKTPQFKIQSRYDQPIQINLCLEEPLLDGWLQAGPEKTAFQKSARKTVQKLLHAAEANFKKYQSQKQTYFKTWNENAKTEIHQPLVVVSDLPQKQQATVRKFLKRTKFDFVAESLSGLMNDPNLKATEVSKIFQNLSTSEAIQFFISRYKSVIRIGGVPTLRLWRDLEAKLKDIPVISFSQRQFSGLGRGCDVFHLQELNKFKAQANNPQKALTLNFQALLSSNAKGLNSAEGAFVGALSRLIVKDDPLYLGNSLPIREWDRFSMQPQSSQNVFGNRGANGIDGQVSSYLGWSKDFNRSWCVIGDLTALYDLASLTMLDVDPSSANRRIVVINNSGGQIFSQLFKNKKYLNEHKIEFSNWAKMFGWKYVLVRSMKQLQALSQLKTGSYIIELKPVQKQSMQFTAQVENSVQSLVFTNEGRKS